MQGPFPPAPMVLCRLRRRFALGVVGVAEALTRSLSWIIHVEWDDQDRSRLDSWSIAESPPTCSGLRFLQIAPVPPTQRGRRIEKRIRRTTVGSGHRVPCSRLPAIG